MFRVAEGAPFGYDVAFATPAVAGNITYTVLDDAGLPIAGLTSVAQALVVGALSHRIVIPPTAAALGEGALFEQRTLQWSYGAGFSGQVVYRVDAALPLPATAEGVRTKLGVFDEELEDGDVDLTLAYLSLLSRLETPSVVTTATGLARLRAVDAVEALAALRVLPALPLKLAKAKSSGTNKFERQASPDFEQLRRDLEAAVDEALAALAPEVALQPPVLLTFATRTDAITG